MPAISGVVVKRLREQKGLRQQELADLLGLSRQETISRWETGKAACDADRWLEPLAAALDVPHEALLVGPGSEVDEAQPLVTVDVPLLGEVPAGAPHLATAYTRERFPVLAHLASKNCYCLRVQGDSMWPELQAMDIVLVQFLPPGSPPRAGRIHVVRSSDGHTLKRVERRREDGRERLVLVPANRDYDEQYLDEMPDAELVGVVIHLVSRAT